MSKILFYDKETTGLPLWKKPSGDPGQPHIVQLAALLVDDETRATIASLNLIACPDGWKIPKEVSDIHGITEEMARSVGIDESLIVDTFHAMWLTSDIRVAHNESFDARIMRIALKRFRDDSAADFWKAGPAKCTARLASPIMKMPPTEAMERAGRHHPKTPKLTEAYEYFIGEPLDGAHDAMVDVIACQKVYFAIVDGYYTEPAKVNRATSKPKATAMAPAAQVGDTDSGSLDAF